MTSTTTATDSALEQIATIAELIDGYALSLAAQNKSPATQTVYLTALRRLERFLLDNGMPVKVAAIRREHIERFLVSLTEEGRRPATVSVYYRSLQPFWRWCIEEGELTVSPMQHVKAPKVAPPPIPVLSPEQIARLLKAVSRRKSFEDVRDEAIIRLMLDSGLRRAELTGMRVADTAPRAHVAEVLGKGGKVRLVPFGDATADALARYLRHRAKHAKAATTDALWLSFKGPLLANGILQMLERRGESVGIEHLYPHRLRHQFAHEWRSAGGSETGLMAIAGWESPSMLRRYAASAASQRAREEHARLRLGDRR
jgi:site-specific recombinase XerD